MNRLDQELGQRAPLQAQAQARMLAALQGELAKAPSKGRWRFEVGAIVASVCFMTAALASALLATGNTDLGVIAARAGVLAMCGLVAAFGATLAVAPPARRAQVWALAAFVVAAVVLVVVRRELGPGSSPEWVCTVTHIGVGAIPLVVGLLALRRGGMRLLAGVALGVSAGTTGAMVGELACGRDATHVLLFHVTAWAAMVSAGALLTRIVRPKSHAP